MKDARTTNTSLPPTKRAGSSYRKLSMKMKRKLRRDKRKARLQNLSLLHFQDRRPDPIVDKEAARAGVSRAVWVERKSRDQSLHTRRNEIQPQMVFSSLLDSQVVYNEVQYRKATDTEIADLWYYSMHGA